jgi:hypothetical protein
VAPGLTYPPIGRTWRDRIADWLIGALLLTILLLGAIMVVFQFPVPLRDTPVIFHEVILPDNIEVCPGDTYEYVADVEILDKSILTMHAAIMDTDTMNTMPGTAQEFIPIARARGGRFMDGAKFVIPDLPPGNYERILAVDSDHADSVPVFISLPFTVTENCLAQ